MGMEMNTATTTWTLNPFEIAATQAKVDKINDRAARKGLAGRIVMEIGEHNDKGEAEVTISATNPIALPGGWTAAAVVDFEAIGDEQLVFALDDNADLTGQTWDRERCDECGVRHVRNLVFVVRSEDNEYRHLGGNCARDFLGHDPRSAFVFLPEPVLEGDDDWDMLYAEAHGKVKIPTSLFLNTAARAIAAFGYEKASDMDPTKDRVLSALSPRGISGWSAWEKERWLNAVVPENITEEITAWAMGQGGSEFADNMRKIAEADFIGKRAWGIAAFIPEGFNRAQAQAVEQVARAAEQAEAGPAPEGKVTVTGTVSKVAVHENDYGYRKVMTVVLDNGARVWGTVPAAIYEVGAGGTVTFTATFSRSDRDETFGFFKRPSKASMVRCEAAEAC